MPLPFLSICVVYCLPGWLAVTIIVSTFQFAICCYCQCCILYILSTLTLCLCQQFTYGARLGQVHVVLMQFAVLCHVYRATIFTVGILGCLKESSQLQTIPIALFSFPLNTLQFIRLITWSTEQLFKHCLFELFITKYILFPQQVICYKITVYSVFVMVCSNRQALSLFNPLHVCTLIVFSL